MASLNRAQLIGRLTRDPELKYTPSGKAVCSFGLATDKWSKDAEGKSADFHNIVVWNIGKRLLAENAAEYLAKGSQVYIEGRIQTRSWEGNDGAKRQTTEIVANEIQFLDKKRDGGTKAEKSAAPGSAENDVDPDDIPF